MRRCSVYWLVPLVEDLHHQRASILDEVGYQVFFFENFEALLREIQVKRSQILILGDEWSSVEAINYAHAFANIPDISAARLLISNSRNDFTLMETAMCEGFRDIIPLDLDDLEWLQRFEFATSGLESILEMHENMEELGEALALEIPARLVWVGARQLWLETRSCPRLGESLRLAGGFVDALGLLSMEVQVKQKQQSNLTYRFSEALIANWYQDAVLQAAPEKIVDTLETLDRIDLGHRPKIFLAIQSPALRNTLLKYIDRRRYEVHTALQKNSLTYEPKYFSPDLVFIEDRLTQGEAKREYFELLRILPEETTVVSIGSTEEAPSSKNKPQPRKMRTLKHVPLNLTELIDRDYLAHTHLKRVAGGEKEAYFPPADHKLSFANIQLEAELIQADYLQFNIRSNMRIGGYSLIRASNPRLHELFGGPIFLKIIQSPELDGPGPYLSQAHVCNLTKPIRASFQANTRKNHG
ncbi:MAG: hypothetical protein NTX25_18960 [Proteobacteria bacterium]|nr:hypothetical protein [Pseudomonadota bacterium]